MDALKLSSREEWYADYLRSIGYVVIPKERRVVLTAGYSISRYAFEHSSRDRLLDAAEETNLRLLAREMRPYAIHECRDIDDPCTDMGLIVTTAVGLIKPSADGSSS